MDLDIKNISVSLRKGLRCYFECWETYQITIRAAALTYTSILSLVPAIAICIFLFARVAKIGEIPSGVKKILIARLPEGLGKWFVNLTDFSDIPTQFKQFLLQNLSSGTGESALKYLDQLISHVNFRAIGFAGLASVLVTSVLLLFAIESSMNIVWRAPRNKAFLRRIILYFLALIFAPLLLSASFTLSAIIASFFPKFVLTAKIGSILSTTILITLGFKFFPNTKVYLNHAVIAAVITAFTAEVLKSIFAYYTKKSLLYSALYGGLSMLPIFLVWLYFNWVVLLSGTLLTYILQNWKYLDKIGDLNQWDPHSIFDGERARLIYEITFLLRQENLRPDQIIKTVDMPEFTVANALEWMWKRGWLQYKRKKFRRYISLTDKAKILDNEAILAEMLDLPVQDFPNKDILALLKIPEKSSSLP